MKLSPLGEPLGLTYRQLLAPPRAPYTRAHHGATIVPHY